jgi:hypothetical protein
MEKSDLFGLIYKKTKTNLKRIQMQLCNLNMDNYLNLEDDSSLGRVCLYIS